MNSVNIVGRVDKIIKISPSEDPKRKMMLEISLKRPFLESGGQVVEEAIQVYLWSELEKEAKLNGSIGAVVAIRARIETVKSDNKFNQHKIIAEQLKFITKVDSK